MVTPARWLLCLSLVACSSDDKVDGGPDSGDSSPSNTGGAGGRSAATGGSTGTGGGSAATGGAVGAGGNGAGAGGKSATGGSSGNGGANAATGGTSATGGKSGDGGTAPSKECSDYCTCMAKNCADQSFPDGCLAECAEQTNWDLPCRQNMCNLAPVQPANNHCPHAAGIAECLNH